MDAGAMDAGPAADAGVSDAGATDAAAADGGAAPACDDGMRNGDETDTDCGGRTCDACPDTGRCAISPDCESNVCILFECQPARCTDAIRNGLESAADCGGPDCPGCAAGVTCSAATDCASGICNSSMLCADSDCTDGVTNGDESDQDCGGVDCAGCPFGDTCRDGGDCDSGVCDAMNECAMPSCTDGVSNGGETGVDCGGTTSCARCPDLARCTVPADCISAACTFGLCGSDPCAPFGSDTFGYTGCSYTAPTTPCPDIRATGTATGLADTDDIDVPIGFSFDFYGTSYTNVTIEADGALAFDGDSIGTLNSCGARTSAPLHFIAAFWDDLDSGDPTSEVFYETLGTAPNRRFVAHWDTERWLSTTGDRFEFRIVLEETSNTIQVCYLDTDVDDTAYDQGLSATSGIGGPTSNSVEYSCNMANLTDDLVLRYTPP